MWDHGKKIIQNALEQNLQNFILLHSVAFTRKCLAQMLLNVVKNSIFDASSFALETMNHSSEIRRLIALLSYLALNILIWRGFVT